MASCNLVVGGDGDPTPQHPVATMIKPARPSNTADGLFSCRYLAIPFWDIRFWDIPKWDVCAERTYYVTCTLAPIYLRFIEPPYVRRIGTYRARPCEGAGGSQDRPSSSEAACMSRLSEARSYPLSASGAIPS